MLYKRFSYRIMALLFLFATTAAFAGGQRLEKETITGTVVAYDVGLELADGSCRQTMIIRTNNHPGNKQQSEYIIVRYENTCMKLLPERVLKAGPKWRFSLTRYVDCDQTLNNILYIQQLNPTGDVYRLPRLKFVPGAEAEKIPEDKKLPCYVLQPGDLEPPLKERLITGVVVWPDGRSVFGASVRLKYVDAPPHLIVRVDEQGRFTIPIFEGFKYAVRAEVVVGGQTLYGETVEITESGDIKPLRLIIK